MLCSKHFPIVETLTKRYWLLQLSLRNVNSYSNINYGNNFSFFLYNSFAFICDSALDFTMLLGLLTLLYRHVISIHVVHKFGPFCTTKRNRNWYRLRFPLELMLSDE